MLKEGRKDQATRVLEFIQKHHKRTNTVPSLDEIAKHFGWSHKAAAKYWVDKLMEQGKLESVSPKSFRGYRIKEPV